MPEKPSYDYNLLWGDTRVSPPFFFGRSMGPTDRIDNEHARDKRIAREQEREASGLCTTCGAVATHKVDWRFCSSGGYCACPSLSCDRHHCPNCSRIDE